MTSASLYDGPYMERERLRQENFGETATQISNLLSEIKMEVLTQPQQTKILLIIGQADKTDMIPTGCFLAFQKLKKNLQGTALTTSSKLTKPILSDNPKQAACVDDVRKMLTLFLANCSEKKISSILGLDALKANTEGNANKARKAIIDCFKDQSRALNLANLGIKALPKSLFAYLDHVTDLDCSSNQLIFLSILPAGLIKFDCHSNHFSRLPFLPLTLEKLDCSRNQLSRLDVLPPKLIDLNCSYNQLVSLKGLRSSLSRLNYSNNPLTSSALPNALQLKKNQNLLQVIEFE